MSEGEIKAAAVTERRCYPLVPLKDVVVFPSMIVPLNVARTLSMKAVEAAMSGHDGKIVLVVQRNASVEEPGPSDLYDVGCVAEILKVFKSTDKALKVGAEGVERVKIAEFVMRDGYYEVMVDAFEDHDTETAKLEVLWKTVKKQFDEYSRLSRRIPLEVAQSILAIDSAGKFSFVVATYLPFKMEERQGLLSTEKAYARLGTLSGVLAKELEVLELERKIQTRVRRQMERTQKEWYLSEQMKAIQKELGHKDEVEEEAAGLRKKIKESGMPADVEARAMKEVDRLAKMMPVSAEATVIRTYVDWLIAMPWSVRTKDHVDLKGALRILNEDHYGLDKVKERILDFLAVRALKSRQKDDRGKSPILCLVGPPGVGKTSLGKSIARAMDRKFVRMSLGGVRDEAEIRGHRRTYIGAMPGRIIQAMRRAGSKNPVFLLDEVDKMSVDFRGDPSAALLEVLDPEQNRVFNDHYLEVDFDLSETFFITTANTLYGIPYPLQDRLEILRIPGYLDIEKEKIARQFLIPKQLNEHGLKPGSVKIGSPTLKLIMDEYTQEAGVRSLEREIATVCRKTARAIVGRKSTRKSVTVTTSNLSKYLGVPAYPAGEKLGKDEAGVATGLAWTEAGGEVLSIEVALLKGRGNVTMTGKLGEVMKESAQAAISYARLRAVELGIQEEFNRRLDIHIHVPEGATPKDGPSAGITIAVALISALTRRPAWRRVAMTGEITLRGNVLPIGGIKEKLLAALRFGCRTVLIPHRNEKDLEEVPKELKSALRIIPVRHMDEVLDHALYPAESRKGASRRAFPLGHGLPISAPDRATA